MKSFDPNSRSELQPSVDKLNITVCLWCHVTWCLAINTHTAGWSLTRTHTQVHSGLHYSAVNPSVIIIFITTIWNRRGYTIISWPHVTWRFFPFLFFLESGLWLALKTRIIKAGTCTTVDASAASIWMYSTSKSVRQRVKIWIFFLYFNASLQWNSLGLVSPPEKWYRDAAHPPSLQLTIWLPA